MAIVLVSSSSIIKLHKLGGLSRTEIYPDSSGGGKSELRLPAYQVLVRAFWVVDSIFLLASQGRRERALRLLIRVFIPSMAGFHPIT